MEAAGVEVPDDNNFAICSEDPHSSLACIAQMQMLSASQMFGVCKPLFAENGILRAATQ